MSDRIHRHLDDPSGPENLSAPERPRAEALRRTADAVAAHLRAAPAPDLAARVMAALPAGAPARAPWRRAADWFWNPRPIRIAFRPAYGLAFAALAGVAVAALPDARDEPARVAQAAAPAAAQPVVYVQFRLESGSAHQVSLAGSFTGWKPAYTLEQKEPGVWTALVPLQPGVHDYVFVVDGDRWMPDPNAPQQVDDSFGGTNSRISLPPLGAST
ncbi:MAG TPA: glycogen-binding domain-containing protein [Longimicrobium sp.]|nr:glycogen-binding domain-containing protein [Longimicrobium sp.]